MFFQFTFDMKRNLSTLSFVAVLLLAASCTNELPDGAGHSDAAAAISFRTPAVTRAAVEGDFPEGAAFSVWGWYTSQNGSNQPFDNVPVTNSNGTWSYTGGDRYWVLGAEYDFYAVYPATGITASCTQDGTLTVTGFDASKTGDAAVDLMTARKTGISYADASTIAPVGLEFGHELAKVNITATVEGGNATVSSVALAGVDILGDFQSPSTWSNATTGSYDSMGNIVLSANPTDLLGDLLVIPQDVDENITLTISYNLDGASVIGRQVQLPATVTRWEAGKSYQYTLNFKGNNIIFTVNVAQWGTSMGGIITVE